jgi:hypothetical protein
MLPPNGTCHAAQPHWRFGAATQIGGRASRRLTAGIHTLTWDSSPEEDSSRPGSLLVVAIYCRRIHLGGASARQVRQHIS